MSRSAKAVPVIEMLAISRTYPGTPPVEALRECHLVLHRGEYMAIMGPSGSGKSTLLNLIGLLDSTAEGVYRFEGTDVRGLNDRERSSLRARRIGFVFQSFHLLPHRSAVENVEMAMMYCGIPRRIRHARAAEVLQRVGLGHRLQAVPTTLSGGECQRVAIARALVGEPALILCDEPTGNLDSATSGAVLDLIDGLHADGLTVVIITHDPTVANRADRRALLGDGTLVEG